MTYCTLAEIIEQLTDGQTGLWNTEYDAIVNRLITAASRAIDAHLKRKPGAFAVSTDETRYYTGSGTDELWIDELAAAPTSVSVAESGDLSSYTLYSASDYFLWPDNALLDGIPYVRIDINPRGSKSIWPPYRRAVKIIGTFGFSVSAPDEIKQVTIIQTVRWFKRGQGAYQDTLANVELGQIRYTKLDPDIASLLEIPKYQRVTL